MSSKEIRERLVELGMEVYSTPVNTEDTFVALARINASGDKDFKIKEARIIFFIEKLLLKSAEASDYKVRLARPWVLKDKKIAYTWDFTVKGDLSVAVKDIGNIRIPKLSITREETVSTQMIKTTKGKVRPVTVSGQ